MKKRNPLRTPDLTPLPPVYKWLRAAARGRLYDLSADEVLRPALRAASQYPLRYTALVVVGQLHDEMRRLSREADGWRAQRSDPGDADNTNVLCDLQLDTLEAAELVAREVCAQLAALYQTDTTRTKCLFRRAIRLLPLYQYALTRQRSIATTISAVIDRKIQREHGGRGGRARAEPISTAEIQKRFDAKRAATSAVKSDAEVRRLLSADLARKSIKLGERAIYDRLKKLPRS